MTRSKTHRWVGNLGFWEVKDDVRKLTVLVGVQWLKPGLLDKKIEKLDQKTCKKKTSYRKHTKNKECQKQYSGPMKQFMDACQGVVFQLCMTSHAIWVPQK